MRKPDVSWNQEFRWHNAKQPSRSEVADIGEMEMLTGNALKHRRHQHLDSGEGDTPKSYTFLKSYGSLFLRVPHTHFFLRLEFLGLGGGGGSLLAPLMTPLL